MPFDNIPLREQLEAEQKQEFPYTLTTEQVIKGCREAIEKNNLMCLHGNAIDMKTCYYRRQTRPGAEMLYCAVGAALPEYVLDHIHQKGCNSTNLDSLIRENILQMTEGDKLIIQGLQLTHDRVAFGRATPKSLTQTLDFAEKVLEGRS